MYFSQVFYSFMNGVTKEILPDLLKYSGTHTCTFLPSILTAQLD